MRLTRITTVPSFRIQLVQVSTVVTCDCTTRYKHIAIGYPTKKCITIRIFKSINQTVKHYQV